MSRTFLGQTLDALPEPHNVVKLPGGSQIEIAPTAVTLHTLKTAKAGVRNPEKLTVRVQGQRVDKPDAHNYWDIALDPVTAATMMGLADTAVASGQTLKFTASGRPPRRHISIEVTPVKEDGT